MTNQKARSVLIAVASRHGSTAEIGAAIGAALRKDLQPPGWRVEVEDCDTIDTIAGYDAVILGSAIYLGGWLKPAKRLLENAPSAPALGMWLFSSGPVAADSPASESVDTNEDVATRLHIKDNIVFAGSLDVGKLGHFERAVTTAMRIAGGDFRDWAAINSWASGIARELSDAAHADDEDGAVRRT